MPAVRSAPDPAVPACAHPAVRVAAGSGLEPLPSEAPTRTALLLLVEPVVCELLALLFRQAGFFSMTAGTLEQARRLAGEVRPDVVLLDQETPGLQQPCTPCNWLQPDAPGTSAHLPCPPTVMVGPERAPCPGDVGCCEALLCIRKPFVPRDLVAQVLDALQASPRSSAGGLQLDAARHSLRILRPGQPALELTLAPMEINLMGCLLQHIGQVLTREEIVRGAWPAHAGVDPRTVDQNIKRLRHTLQAAGAPALIRTVHGVGYRLLPVDGL